MSEPPSNTPPAPGDAIPSTLVRPGATRFWLAVLLTGVGTGIGAAALTRLLELVQHLAWSGSGTNILDAVEHAGVWRHVLVLLGAGLLTGAGQLILKQLSSGNGIDTTAAIWFHAGRMPALRTLGSAVLSVLDVGMGVSLGREGAPKQAGAVIAKLFLRQGTLVRRATPTLGGLWRRGWDGSCLRRSVGWCAFRARGNAWEAGTSVRAACNFCLCGCHCGVMACATGRADLHHSRLFQLSIVCRMGASRGPDRGRSFGRLCSNYQLGRSQ